MKLEGACMHPVYMYLSVSCAGGTSLHQKG